MHFRKCADQSWWHSHSRYTRISEKRDNGFIVKYCKSVMSTNIAHKAETSLIDTEDSHIKKERLKQISFQCQAILLYPSCVNIESLDTTLNTFIIIFVLFLSGILWYNDDIPTQCDFIITMDKLLLLRVYKWVRKYRQCHIWMRWRKQK